MQIKTKIIVGIIIIVLGIAGFFWVKKFQVKKGEPSITDVPRILIKHEQEINQIDKKYKFIKLTGDIAFLLDGWGLNNMDDFSNFMNIKNNTDKIFNDIKSAENEIGVKIGYNVFTTKTSFSVKIMEIKDNNFYCADSVSMHKTIDFVKSIPLNGNNFSEKTDCSNKPLD